MRPAARRRAARALPAAAALACMALHAAEPRTKPPGAPESGATQALAVGAAVLQSTAPLSGFDIHLDGFHPMKDAPQRQMEAHHYCRQVNEDFAQCVLFDADTRQANLTGIEYIISGKLFDTLPESERRYWHPHNYEILSGQLIAPGIPGAAEHALMKRKINSYGKTWHVWHSDATDAAADALPLGDPMLAWSFNRDGEADPDLVRRRDQRMRVDTAAKRRERTDLAPLAHPQAGADALQGRFGAPADGASGRRPDR